MNALPRKLSDRQVVAGLILLALAYQWLSAAQILFPVIRDGAWFDTDDAMRMVGVRAWLAGQDWFDLTAHRMGVQPVQMHWSRIVDVPLAGLIRTFGLVFNPGAAETLARLVFPAALFVALVIGIKRAAETVAGPEARWPAILLAALGGATADQFVPGRIDHHAPQIVLLTFMILSLLRSFEPDRGRVAGVAGGLAALSLSISIENVPFLLVLAGSLGLHWVLRPEAARDQLRSFGAILAGAALLLFAVTVPPGMRLAPVCDAFGAPYLLAVVTGGAVLLGLAARPPRALAGRLALGAAGAGLTLLILRLVYPACLHDPFADLPPLLRDVWLPNVSEARSLSTVIAAQPAMALPLLVPPLLALAGCLWQAVRAPDAVRRSQFLILAALCGGGLLAANWMVRTESSLGAPVMIAGAILASTAAHKISAAKARLLPLLIPLVICVPFSSGVWATLVPLPAKASPVMAKAGASPETTSHCTAPQDFLGLGALPPLRLLTSMDAGPYILASTHHAVLAGPYHRNHEGNVMSLQTFLAKPDEARSIARTSGASHLAFCGGLSEVEVLSARAPDGLAARLLAGETPDWLVPVQVAGPWRLYQID